MIKFLEVKNFRNIDYIKLEFQELCSILLGANGIGKSNTLNALNFCLTHNLKLNETLRVLNPLLVMLIMLMVLIQR